MLRILLAVVLTCIGVSGSMAATMALNLSYPLACGLCVLSFLAAVWLADRRRYPEQVGPSLEQMKRAGLLEDVPFSVVRSFGVEEYEDEGEHYFLELHDTTVLYLRGQYLEEYEPTLFRARRFPSSMFRLVRQNGAARLSMYAATGYHSNRRPSSLRFRPNITSTTTCSRMG